MAFKLLLGLMMIGAAFAETGLAEGAVPSKQNVSAAKETLEPTINVSERSTFQRCPCGVDCSRETTVDVFQRSSSGRQCPCRVDCENVGVFQRSNFLHCACGVDCQKDMGKEHGFQLHQGCGCLSCNLRGATESEPAEGAKVEGVKAEDLLALLAEQEQDWDAASVPGDSQLTFCRCGSLGNSCRSC
eukprot:Skav208407  [mRNA]  locus=scaffold1179:379718:382448:+ [translate_table: standard]